MEDEIWKEAAQDEHLNAKAEEPNGYSGKWKKTSSYFGPHWDGPIKFPRGMFSIGGRLEKMAALIMQGKSTRAIRREVGGSLMTIVKLRRVLELLAGEEVMCPCGRPIRGHVWCSWRESQSEGRKRYLEQCAEKSKNSKKTPTKT